MSVSIDTQIKCAKRELAMRRNVYPKWVAYGKMNQTSADAEIAAMAAIVSTLERLKQKEPVQMDLLNQGTNETQRA